MEDRPREWDATSYDELTLPHEGWGLRVLDRMRLRGDERVLDAGCGTGRDAATLLARHPGLDLVAVDGSQQMLDVAAGRLAGTSARLVQADLGRPLPLAELGGRVDAVMSVATFHWVEDHELLFAHLAAVMSPGATLTSDCGGRGNVAGVDAAIARVTGLPDQEWEFADEVTTRRRLEGAGFAVQDVRLRPAPFVVEDVAVLEAFLASVVLGSYLADLPAAEHAGFVRAVREALAEPVVDYVRLEIDAVRR